MPKVKDLNPTLERVRQHMLAIGFTEEESHRYLIKVGTWIRHSGPEWTVERLKSLKKALVDMLASGEHYIVPPGWATRLNRNGQTIFKDRMIHEVFSRAPRNKKFAEGFARIQTAFVLDELSEKQKVKLVKAVETPYKLNRDLLNKSIKSLKIKVPGAYKSRKIYAIGKRSRTMLDYIGGTKSAPYFGGKTPRTAPRSDWKPFHVEEILIHDRLINQLWKEYPQTVSQRLWGCDNYPYITEDTDFQDFPAGVLSSLQEGGTKVRWIANPHLSLQAFGEPLKDRLFAYAKEMYPEVKTHDQDSGRADAVQWISEGKTVYSYDCSSFTDRFPLALQSFVLDRLREARVIDDFDLAAFDVVMSKSWYSKDLRREISWEVGQPLGFNPSFHLATVSHAVVLDTLDEDRTGLWRVVGDDVIIGHAPLAHKYYRLMTEVLGVEINTTKSVISDRVAEFLGKLLFPEGENPSIKVKLLSQVSQYMRCIAYYGDEFIGVVNNKEKLYCLAAFLPESMGGLGITPKGMSLAEFISCLNMDELQRVSLNREIRDFHDGKDPKGRFEALKSFLELKSIILEKNTERLSLLGIGEIQTHVGDSVFLNELTGLCSTGRSAPRASTERSTNSWTDIVDTGWLLGFKDAQVMSIEESVIRFTTKGYSSNSRSNFKSNISKKDEKIRDKRKGSTLSNSQSFNLLKDGNRHDDQHPKSARKFFNREGLRKILNLYE